MHRSAKTKALSALATAKGSLDAGSLQELVSILCKVVSNILKKPADDNVRSLRFGNKTVKNKIAAHAGGVEFLLALGFVDIGSGEDRALVLPIGTATSKDGKSKDSDDISSLKWAKRTLEDMMTGERSSTSQSTAAPIAITHVPGFDPFASKVVRVAPQPRAGQGKTDRELAVLKAKKERLERAEGVPARNLMLAPPGTKVDLASVSTTASATTGTAAKGDGGVILEAAKLRTQKQKEESKFRTKNMRELQSLRQSQVFTKILIRVAFPDKLVMYAHFAPFELVGDIKRMILQLLAPALAAEAPEMQLFVTPPRQSLDDSHTLTEAQLVPAALVYLDWAVDTRKVFPNFSYLRADYAAVVSNGEVFADETAKAAAGDKRRTDSDVLYPTSVPLVKRPSSPPRVGASAAGGSSRDRSGKKDSASSKGVPKWFKR